jgi:hypothetical protein
VHDSDGDVWVLGELQGEMQGGTGVGAAEKGMKMWWLRSMEGSSVMCSLCAPRPSLATSRWLRAKGDFSRLPLKERLTKTAVVHLAVLSASAMKVEYASLRSLCSMVFLDTMGDSLRLPVSVHGKSSRSEYSSLARVVRVSA